MAFIKGSLSPFGKKKRSLEFNVFIHIHHLVGYPYSGKLYVKWKDMEEGIVEHTARVLTRDNEVQWEERFQYKCKMFVNSKTNMVQPHRLHFSVRQDSNSTAGFYRVGTLDLDLADYVSSRVQITKRYLLQNSKYNALLEMTTHTVQTSGDPMFRSPTTAYQAPPPRDQFTVFSDQQTVQAGRRSHDVPSPFNDASPPRLARLSGERQVSPLEGMSSNGSPSAQPPAIDLRNFGGDWVGSEGTSSNGSAVNDVGVRGGSSSSPKPPLVAHSKANTPHDGQGAGGGGAQDGDSNNSRVNSNNSRVDLEKDGGSDAASAEAQEAMAVEKGRTSVISLDGNSATNSGDDFDFGKFDRYEGDSGGGAIASKGEGGKKPHTGGRVAKAATTGRHQVRGETHQHMDEQYPDVKNDFGPGFLPGRRSAIDVVNDVILATAEAGIISKAGLVGGGAQSMGQDSVEWKAEEKAMGAVEGRRSRRLFS